MKILHCSDLHLGISLGSRTNEQGINLRVCDFLNTFDKVIDYAIQEKVDLFMLLGDIFKNCIPSNLLQREFAKRVKRLSDAGILSFILIGNHDRPGVVHNAHSLELYRELQIPNVIISDVPGVYTLNRNDKKLGILSLPYFFKDSFARYEKLINKFEKQELDFKIIASHCMVQGSQMSNDYVCNEAEVHLDFFNRKVDYVGLGDIHKYQVLSDNPPVVYSGSLERNNFGETDEKGFVMIELDKNKKASFKFIPLMTREYISISCVSEVQFNSFGKESIKDKIIRIALLDNFDVDEDKLKDAFYYEIVRVPAVHADVVISATVSQNYLDVFSDYFKGHADKNELLTRVTELQKNVN